MKFIILMSSLLAVSSVFARHHLKEMPQQTKEAVKACHDEAKFEKGKRPTKEERKKFKECMKSKGVDIKERTHHKMNGKMKEIESEISE